MELAAVDVIEGSRALTHGWAVIGVSRGMPSAATPTPEPEMADQSWSRSATRMLHTKELVVGSRSGNGQNSS